MPSSIIPVNRANFTNAVPAAVYMFTLPFTPTTGNTLIATVAYEGPNANTLSTITEVGGTWVNVITSGNNHIPSNIERNSIWMAQNVAAAGTLLTFTFAGAVNSIIVNVTEYSGLSNAIVIDQLSGASCNIGFPDVFCGPTLDTGTTPPTTVAAELFVAAIGQHGAPVFSAPTHGFTIINQSSAGVITSSYIENIVGSVQQANTSVTSTISGSTTADNWSAALATFIAAPVPVPPPQILFPINRLASDYIDDLRNRFAEINFTPWIEDTQLIDWLNTGVDDIAFRTLPPRYEVFPPFQISSIGGQTNYELPDDFFRLKEFGDTSGLFFNGDALLFEDKTAEMEQFQFGVGLMPTNQPVWFWFWAKKFFLYPPPADNTGVIKMYYYRLPIFVRQLTDEVDIDRPWEEVLIKFVLWKALEKDKHPMSQIYRQEYEQALSNQYSESRIRVEKRARYVHSHDYWGREDR